MQINLQKNAEKYGDQVTLLNDGRWKCVRGNYVSYRD